MKQYRYNLTGLDCANCARELEEGLNKRDDLNKVIVNFNTLKLSFYSDQAFSLNQVQQMVELIEPGVKVVLHQIEEKNMSLYPLLIGFVIGLFGYFVKTPISFFCLIVSYFILLYKPAISAVQLLIRQKTLNENALITISCIGAFVIGETLEGMMVVCLYLFGKFLEEKAIKRSRSSIQDLIEMKVICANRKRNECLEQIEVEQVQIGDILVVKKGEKIPVDGILITEQAVLDTSALTGESNLVTINTGEVLLSGSINMGDLLEIECTHLYKESTVFKILELVEEATDKKARTETLVARLSKIYTPLVLCLSIFVMVFLPFFNVSWIDSIYRGLTFLVISCPCAIAISVPLSYFTGIGSASRNGILVKGSNYLDALVHLDRIIFDKTGTLTTGTFELQKIEIFDSNYTKEEILCLVRHGEAFSNHPIAHFVLSLSDEELTKEVKDYQELSGVGISYQIDDRKIKVGNRHVCRDCLKDADIHVNINGQHVASFHIADGIKKGSISFIQWLDKNKIETYLFTGDKTEVAQEIGSRLGIKHIDSELLPQDKYVLYEQVKQRNEVVAFVGDGVNDAPVLKRADIGISMGGIGSNAAIEASDVVIMNDDIEKIKRAIMIAKYTNHIIKQNLIFAFIVKIAILVFSVFGLASMWAAVFADTGVTLLAILNTLRIRRRFNG